MSNLVVPPFEGLSRESFWSSFVTSNGFRHLAEIGDGSGQFSCHLLRASSCIETYTMLEDFCSEAEKGEKGDMDLIFEEAKTSSSVACDKRILKRGLTIEVLSNIPDQSWDFVYRGGDLTLRSVVIQMIGVWPKIREGGVMAGDHFTNAIMQNRNNSEPALVNPFALYFAEAMNSPITVLPHNQFFIHKDSNSGHRVSNLSGSSLNHSLRSLIAVPANPSQPSSLTRSIGKFGKKAVSSILWRTSRKYREAKIEGANPQPFPVWIKSAGCLFIHIPKTAGTSISLSLYGRQIGHNPLQDWLKWYPKSIRELTVFTVTRNPIQRFVSAFWFLKKGGMNNSDLAFSRQHLSTYETPEQLAKTLVDPKLQTDILAAMHFRPQIEFISTKSGSEYPILLIPMEHLREGVERLSKQLGSSIELPHLNKSEYPNEKSIDSEAMEILLQIYRQDRDLHERALKQFR